MNFPLFKLLLKRNWGLAAGFTALMLVQMLTSTFLLGYMETMIEGLPPELMGMIPTTSLTDNAMAFIGASVLADGTMYVTIFFVMLVYRLITRPIDSTGLGTILSAGVSRRRYVTTAAVFMFASLFVIFAVNFLATGCALLIWGAFNWAVWLNVNVTAFLTCAAVAAIAFFIACALAGKRAGTVLMIIVPIVLFLLYMLSTGLEFFRWFTPYAWADSAHLTAGTFGLWWLVDLGYIAISALGFVGAFLLFKKRQLSI